MDKAAAAKLLQDGLAMHRAGMRREAMDSYIKVLRADPENADALYYVAVITMQEGQIQEGVKLARRAIGFDAKQARLHNLLGQGLHRLDQRQEALASFNRAIDLQPDFADAHGNRANLLAEIGRPGEALISFDHALKIRPNSAEDWGNRGAALHDLDRLDEALDSYQRAIDLRPNFANAYVNRSDILRDLGQLDDAAGQHDAKTFDDAEAGYTTALQIDRDLAEAHIARGILRLLRGEWEGGWGDYEYRSKVKAPSYKPLPYPLWRGEAMVGERLVLLAEQGLGDAMFFGRFAPLLTARGFDVTILARKAMKPLLATLSGVTIATSPEELTSDPRPIRWLPLMSAAGVLNVRPDTIPAEVPYLAAEPERIATWGTRLGEHGFKIGINWAAGHTGDKRRRDIPLAAFAPLAALPNVRLISLQKGAATAQIAQVPFRDKIETLDTDPDPDADFFLDTAAVASKLQLIVTCDTSVTHLAGALGRPVFTAIPAIADWRWLLNRDDTPWYPTMRLFRQRRLNDWSDVLDRIADAARTMA